MCVVNKLRQRSDSEDNQTINISFDAVGMNVLTPNRYFNENEHNLMNNYVQNSFLRYAD